VLGRLPPPGLRWGLEAAAAAHQLCCRLVGVPMHNPPCPPPPHTHTCRWAEAMAAQGSGGAFEISQRMTAMLGWGATASFAEDWTWDQAAETYALDPEMAAKLRKSNPQVDAAPALSTARKHCPPCAWLPRRPHAASQEGAAARLPAGRRKKGWKGRLALGPGAP
jgi:hypothetical protein